jgi:PilZ domain
MHGDRAYPRTEIEVTGKIAVRGRAPSTSCFVRNLSEGGACLQLASTAGLPSAFTLDLGTTSRPCRVIWRTETQLGVTFKPDPRAARQDPPRP